MFCPLLIGISDISCPDLVIIGDDKGITSSRLACRNRPAAIGFKRNDSCVEYQPNRLDKAMCCVPLSQRS